jgi:hypothetical protein
MPINGPFPLPSKIADKFDVGLGNVDNTSDANKPVSGPQQAALNGKANLVHGHTAADISNFATAVQNAVATFLVAGANVTLTLGDGSLTIAASGGGGGGGLADGDYGDVTVSGDGTVITIDDSAVTLAKMANLASGTLIGRTAPGTGVPEALTLAAVKAALALDNVDNTSDANKPVSGPQQTALNGKQNLTPDTIVVSGGTRTITAADEGRVIVVTNATSNALTVDAAFNGRSCVVLWPASAAAPTIAPGSGVTLNGGTATIQCAPGPGIVFISQRQGVANTFDVVGSLYRNAITLNAALSSNNTYEGTVITGLNAGVALAQWDAVYLASNGTWQLADANGTGTYPCRGLAVAAAAANAAATVLTDGVVRNNAWSWTPGGDVYISTTAGGLTQTPPAAAGDRVQKIGYALTSAILRVNIGSGEILERAA